MPLLYNAAVLRPPWSGVEKAVFSIAEALSALPGIDLRVLLPHDAPTGAIPASAIVRLPRWAGTRAGRIAWELHHAPRLARQLRADAFVSPAYVAPPRLPCPSVLFLYDLHVYTLPRLCSPANVLHYRLRIPGSLRRAAAVAVPSPRVLDELRARFPEAAEKASVVPLGVSDAYRAPPTAAQIAAVRRRHGLPGGLILFVGDPAPRKNLPVLVEAWRRLRADDPSLGLVLAGAPPRNAPPAEEGLVRTGYIDEAELPALYAAAAVFAYPSLDEGYGLPVSEALALGRPVVAAPGAVPDARAEAVVPCDPRSPASLAEALRAALAHPRPQAPSAIPSWRSVAEALARLARQA